MFILPFAQQNQAEVWPRFQSLLKLLHWTKVSMLWVRCAFGNVLMFRGAWLLLCWLNYFRSSNDNIGRGRVDQGNDEIFKLCKLSEVSNSQGVSHSIPVLLGPSLFNADGRGGAYYEYSFRQLDCHDDVTYKNECLSLFPLGITLGTTQTFPCLALSYSFSVTWFILIIFWE